MADSHAINGSVRTRANNHVLAESLSNIVENIESNSASNLGRSCEEDRSQANLQICEDLVKDLATTSAVEVAKNLARNRSSKQLTNLREYAVQLCRQARTECPSGRLVRRLTRQSGVKVELKFATDIVELVKYWKAGEFTQQLRDMFSKVNSNSNDVNDVRSPEEVPSTEVLQLMENLEAKLMVVKQECFEAVNNLEREIDELQASLQTRDIKIHSLETELATLKGRSKTNYEQLDDELKDQGFNLNLLRDKIKCTEDNIGKVKTELIRFKKDLHNEEKKKSQTKSSGDSSTRSISSNAKTNANIGESSSGVKTMPETLGNRKVTVEIVEDDNCPLEAVIIESSQGQGLASSDNNSVNNEQIPSEIGNKDDEFVGVVRQNIKRIFLGGVRDGVTVQNIAKYMTERNIKSTFIRLLKSKRRGTTSVRISVVAKDFNTAKETAFWPAGVHARPWMSSIKWQDVNKPKKEIVQPPSTGLELG